MQNLRKAHHPLGGLEDVPVARQPRQLVLVVLGRPPPRLLRGGLLRCRVVSLSMQQLGRHTLNTRGRNMTMPFGLNEGGCWAGRPAATAAGWPAAPLPHPCVCSNYALAPCSHRKQRLASVLRRMFVHPDSTVMPSATAAGWIAVPRLQWFSHCSTTPVAQWSTQWLDTRNV